MLFYLSATPIQLLLLETPSMIEGIVVATGVHDDPSAVSHDPGHVKENLINTTLTILYCIGVIIDGNFRYSRILNLLVTCVVTMEFMMSKTMAFMFKVLEMEWRFWFLRRESLMQRIWRWISAKSVTEGR
ncbi:hypothetical protein HN51_063812 [Arachis hypogaea]